VIPVGPHYAPVRFVESRQVRSGLWLKVVATGWVPAHDPMGKAVVWFHSRNGRSFPRSSIPLGAPEPPERDSKSQHCIYQWLPLQSGRSV
jgi:hypothetical protein